MKQFKTLKRGAFRWTLDGDVCRWSYGYFSLEEVIEIHKLTLIEKIDEDLAIVSGELQ